jgi:outer membrane protein assembly factor BamD
MNVPIPTPTPEQIAASVALENSRRQYRLQDRATLLFMHQPDVVLTARDGEPTLTDPTPTLAPHITTKIIADFNNAMNPNAPAAAAPGTPAPNGAAPAPATDAAAAPAPAAAPPAAPLQFQEIPAANAAGGTPSGSSTTETVAVPTTPASGNSMGVEILTPGANVAPPPDPNGGLKAVGPPNATPLPAAEKASEAPGQTNDVAGTPTPSAQAPNANGKNGKPEFDKSDESSSKHKKKKGLGKLNPF